VNRLAKLSTLGVLALAACASTPEPAPARPETDRVDALAAAFRHWVHGHYAAREAAERRQTGPPLRMQLSLREDLKNALLAFGVELPEATDDRATLRPVVESVRSILTEHDYVFLPQGDGSDAGDDDQGIALAHVRSREPARVRTLWGREVHYKLIVYEPFLRDYAGWKAEAARQRSVVFSPGRFSRDAVFIDHEQLVLRAKLAPGPEQEARLASLVNEVELREAAYLLFVRDIPDAASRDPVARSAAIERLHERVLWTAVRYGDPDVALQDVRGLAQDERAPAELRAAASQVRARIPAATEETSPDQRKEILHRAAEDAWITLAKG
jgi:hypothetical protein